MSRINNILRMLNLQSSSINEPPNEDENQPDPDAINMSRIVRSYYLGRQLQTLQTRMSKNL